MSYIVHPDEGATTQQVGGKAAALAALRRFDFLIPAWFVLDAAAFSASLSRGKRRTLEAAKDSAAALALLQDIEVDLEVRTQLARALAKLCPNGELVAVRSSACDEDGCSHSFAGQLDSFLFVHHRDIENKVVAVWR